MWLWRKKRRGSGSKERNHQARVERAGWTLRESDRTGRIRLGKLVELGLIRKIAPGHRKAGKLTEPRGILGKNTLKSR
jgi:hypothetical protein